MTDSSFNSIGEQAMDECVLVEKIYREEGISTQPSALSQPNTKQPKNM
jgi:hypothetical protein